MIEARIGGLLFQGGDAKATYTLRGGDGLKGWLAGVGSRFTREDRPTADGQFIGRRLLGGRVITMQGAIHATTPYDMDRRIEALNTLGIAGEPTRLTVKQPSGITWAMVYRDGEPSVEIVSWPIFARYQIQFFAPDPRRYGAVRRRDAASSVRLPNDGNYAASPRLQISGDMPGGYTLTDGRRQFVVTRALQAGVPHDIDMADGSLRVGGVRVFGGVGSSTLLTIPPAGAIVLTAGGALISAAWHDTSI